MKINKILQVFSIYRFFLASSIQFALMLFFPFQFPKTREIAPCQNHFQKYRETESVAVWGLINDKFKAFSHLLICDDAAFNFNSIIDKTYSFFFWLRNFFNKTKQKLDTLLKNFWLHCTADLTAETVLSFVWISALSNWSRLREYKIKMFRLEQCC